MPRRSEHVEPLPEYDRGFNQTRFIDETTIGLITLLEKSGKNKAWLAKRLGHAGRSAITKAFQGDNNFKLETLADISLALGRAVHVVWGTDIKEVRFPRDEAEPLVQISSADSMTNEPPVGTEHVEKTIAQFNTVRFTRSDGTIQTFPTGRKADQEPVDPTRYGVAMV